MKDKRHGMGKLYYKDGSINESEWKDGVIVHGKDTYASGNWYEGEFKNWDRHGKGVYHYANGDWYEGEFSEGKFHGAGVYHYANGTIEQGQWEMGAFKG